MIENPGPEQGNERRKYHQSKKKETGDVPAQAERLLLRNAVRGNLTLWSVLKEAFSAERPQRLNSAGHPDPEDWEPAKIPYP